MRGIFGFSESDNIGKYAFPPVQAVPSFSNSFPHIFGMDRKYQCLIPAAIDQDTYFRMTRDVAQKLNYNKPAQIYSSFFSGLKGKRSKMSSSEASTCILMSDTAKEIKDKINKYALSGGQQTVEEHRRIGANLDIDVSVEYLEFFLEDDEQLADIKEKYSSGKMLTCEVKEILVEVLNKFVKEFQEARAKITDDDVANFMSRKKIDPFPRAWKEELEKRAVEKKKADEEKARIKAEKKGKGAAGNDDPEAKAKKEAEKARKKAAAVEFAKKKKEQDAAKKAAEGKA